MPRRYSSSDAERALTRIGFRFVRLVGSHMRFRAIWRGRERNVTLTQGQRVIPPRTLRDIIVQSGLSAAEFHDLVEGHEVRE